MEAIKSESFVLVQEVNGSRRVRTTDNITSRLDNLPISNIADNSVKPRKANNPKRKKFNVKVICSLSAFLVIVIGVSSGLPIYFLKNPNKNTDDSNNIGQNNTAAPVDTTNISLGISTVTEGATTGSMEASTTKSSTLETSTSTSTSTTTEDSQIIFQYFNRSEWKATTMQGTKRLTLPVNRIVVHDTQTESCSDDEDCKAFVRQRQIATYGSYYLGISLDDIKENFLISQVGTIFEGRGFSHEGQHTYDACKTSYNSGLGVSFIGSYTSRNLTENQEKAFVYLIQKFIDEGKIIADYKLYFHEQLSGLNGLNDPWDGYLARSAKTWSNWRKSKLIKS